MTSLHEQKFAAKKHTIATMTLIVLASLGKLTHTGLFIPVATLPKETKEITASSLQVRGL
jgi:hypothetical protein